MNTRFALREVESLAEAVKSLTEHDGDVRILAGGTDVLVRMRNGTLAPRCLVSLNRLEELRGIDVLSDGTIRIGALTTMSRVAADPRIGTRYRALAEAAGTVGSVQIQNVGTVAGNLCNASPAADTAPALLIYDAQLNIVGPEGRRSVPLEDFFLGPGRTVLDSGEVVESVDLPATDSRQGSCYLKLGRTRGVDLAVVGAAVRLEPDRTVRLAVASVAPVPLRLKAAEAELSGGPLEPKRLDKAFEAVREMIDPISDLRASREYRQEMTMVLIRRGIKQLLGEATGSGD
jgi:carbon-monoxide dehydrogenase medium subunit